MPVLFDCGDIEAATNTLKQEILAELNMSQTAPPDDTLPGTDDGAGEPATVARGSDGDPLAVAIVLTPSELESLGIDPDAVEAVRPRVVGGTLHIKPVC